MNPSSAVSTTQPNYGTIWTNRSSNSDIERGQTEENQSNCLISAIQDSVTSLRGCCGKSCMVISLLIFETVAYTTAEIIAAKKGENAGAWKIAAEYSGAALIITAFFAPLLIASSGRSSGSGSQSSSGISDGTYLYFATSDYSHHGDSGGHIGGGDY